MRYWHPSHRALLCILLTVTLPGCGVGGWGSSAGYESDEQLSIGQIGQIFRVYQKGKRPPPKGLADLVPLEQGYPAAIASIRSKEIIVYWGAGISDWSEASSTVLAYHKDVPEKGGEVLMQDGKPRRMTPEQFKEAKKPAGNSASPTGGR